MTAHPIRLLVCDDHPVVRSGLRGMLRSQPDFDVVADAPDGARAVALAQQFRPDVVLMDLKMPEMDGVTATEKIKADRPETEVLVLTTYETDADILRAVEAGATGYLLKDSSEELLFDAIRQAARGKSPLAPSVASRLVGRVRSTTAGEGLSEREIEILRLVAQGANNKDIAQALLIS
ncbi:MAG: response regulator transcription factor, partial [Actinomycetota bacterium]|nr:response regulator transcription factor [Actinomycetota bacterium]